NQNRHFQFHQIRPPARPRHRRLAGRHRSRSTIGADGNDRRSANRPERPQQRAAGPEPPYSPPIPLDQTKMQIDERVVELSPGMAVTVEIKTGERRIVEFLLSPLLRYKQESLRER